MKFNARKVYRVPRCEHSFGTLADAQHYAVEHDIDPLLIERYDSTKEYRRWLELLQLEQAGEIENLERQVEFELIPTQRELDHYRTRNLYDVVTNDGGVVTLKTATDARTLCKALGLSPKIVEKRQFEEPIYKVVEKAAHYTADFTYRRDHELVVEDCKTDITRREKDYVLRRKLMLYVHGIKILET